MMITSVIPTPLETQQEAKNTVVDAVVKVSTTNQSSPLGTSPYLPVILPKSLNKAPESFIDLFWQLTDLVSHRLKTVIEQGISLWVEAFSTIVTVQQLETQRGTSLVEGASYLSPAFRLKTDDTEASMVSSLIAEHPLNTAKPFKSLEREAWLSANQWSGLDDLFPAEEIKEEVLSETLIILQKDTEVSVPSDSVEGASSSLTATTILDALHEAYPITTPEEEACLQHPLIQRGREVKQNINELVDAYFSAEASAD